MESNNRTNPVATLTGNIRNYCALRQLPGLRLLLAFSAAAAEMIVHRLRPALILHFELSRLNLRKATYRTNLHTNVGQDGNSDEINNRLCLLNEVVALSLE